MPVSVKRSSPSARARRVLHKGPDVALPITREHAGALGRSRCSVTPESDVGTSLISVVDSETSRHQPDAPLESVTNRLPSQNVSPSSGLPAGIHNKRTNSSVTPIIRGRPHSPGIEPIRAIKAGHVHHRRMAA